MGRRSAYSSVGVADQIFFIDDGHVIEHGTHAELLSHEGPYREFVEARSRIEGWQLVGRDESPEQRSY